MLNANTLQDNELRLTPYGEGFHIDAAVSWYHDPEVLRDSEGAGTEAYDRATVTRMYDYLSHHGELYIIEVRVHEKWQAIGDAALCRDMIPIVIGDAAYRGRGLGSRVLQLLVSRATALGWHRILVKKVYRYNLRSQRLFASLGFREVGEFIDAQGRKCVQLELKLQT